MLLRFNKSDVKLLLTHTKLAPAHTMPYGDGVPAPAGLLLVGDHGVYLMSNGSPNLLIDGTQGKPSPTCKAKVVYAEECNPETMPFDEWWEAKRNTFGGDDGVEFLPVDEVETGMDYDPDFWVIEIDPDEAEFFILCVPAPSL